MRIFIFLIGLLLFTTSDSFSQKWENLIKDNLDNWEKKNGNASYELIDGVIIGTSTINTPNTFLCTKKKYSDFILELEVLVDANLNSGIQFRSLSDPAKNNGRVHGYQAEIDPSPRAWSGGIYDEARRGWLYPLANNQKGRKAFINGRWNHYRIEAIGFDLRVWVNGINTSNLRDDLTSEGLIALQVHGIGSDEEKNGTQVRWKNIKILTEGLEKERREISHYAPEINIIPNTLTKNEKRLGWKLLWDGKSSKGWRGAKLDEFPKTGWKMEEGVLTVLESGGGESENGGDIVTKAKYSNFELIVDFKITEGANSGIKYFVDPALNKGTGSAIGLEFQILDDIGHPDAKQGVNGNRTVGSLYDLITAENLSQPGRNKPFKGVNNWNRARILVDGNKVEHWLNNDKVVEFERNTQLFRALVSYSKYKVWPGFGDSESGHILLQDHGNTVHFRNIKIREF